MQEEKIFKRLIIAFWANMFVVGLAARYAPGTKAISALALLGIISTLAAATYIRRTRPYMLWPCRAFSVAALFYGSCASLVFGSYGLVDSVQGIAKGSASASWPGFFVLLGIFMLYFSFAVAFPILWLVYFGSSKTKVQFKR